MQKGLCLEELDADGFTEGYVLMGVGEESCVSVTSEHLDLVTIAATTQEETPIARDVEVTGMGCCGLVADAREHSGLAINGKNGDAISFQTIAGIKKFTIETKMYICPTSRSHAIRDDFLQRL